ncbi:MAG: hypothetical protein SNJ85_07860 [Cyanobacteriota bacterium]
MFQLEGIPFSDIERLVDTFSDQAIDFFGASRSQIYDQQVWCFIEQVGLERVSFRLLKSKEGTPSFPPPQFSLEQLLEWGRQLKTQQQQVETRRFPKNISASNRRQLENILQGQVHLRSPPPMFLACLMRLNSNHIKGKSRGGLNHQSCSKSGIFHPRPTIKIAK